MFELYDGHKCHECGRVTTHMSVDGYYRCGRCDAVERCNAGCDNGLVWRRGIKVPCFECPAGEVVA